MIVTIMYRNNFHGGDGWTYYPKTVEIADNCPVCGGKRGEIKPHRFCDDGEWFTVDKWENPCGHLDKYKDCYFEALRIEKQKHIEAYKTALECLELTFGEKPQTISLKPKLAIEHLNAAELVGRDITVLPDIVGYDFIKMMPDYFREKIKKLQTELNDLSKYG